MEGGIGFWVEVLILLFFVVKYNCLEPFCVGRLFYTHDCSFFLVEFGYSHVTSFD